jgi:hypothetical protein
MLPQTRYPQWNIMLLLVLFFHPQWMDETRAFVIHPQKVSHRTSSTQLAQAPRFDKEGHHIDMNFVSTGNVVDHERAQYCADHFGSCSVEEIEAMKHGMSFVEHAVSTFICSNPWTYLRYHIALTLLSLVTSKFQKDLHQERLQNLMVGGGGYGSLAFSVDSGTAMEDRILEEELELQLQMLKEHQASPDFSLFPVDPVEDQVLPHLHDANDAAAETKDTTKDDKGFRYAPTPEEIFVLEETVLEENLLEPIAICLVIVGLALLPQFM